uniref:Hexosyltransferase n=1 Tax=Rodentolepis nana TaxID=102285 RepID=A0A158QGM6_RODNA
LALIDVALVAGGENAARQVPILVKSIFYHRLFSQNCKRPHPNFRFHIVCSGKTCKGLSVLFDTWKIAGLTQVHFYDIVEYEAIVLDLDTLIEGDLMDLWKTAEQLENDEVIGLVENQSEWYLMQHGKSFWPTLGHGFNTGVMLLDLKKMRKIDWSQYWRNVTRIYLKNASHTSLADQDIVNTAIYFNANIVRRLPCVWNLQLGENANYAHCLTSETMKNVRLGKKGLQILHWNSPSKSISLIKTGLGLDKETEKELDKTRRESMTPANLRLKFAMKLERLSNLDGNLFRGNATLSTEVKTSSYEKGIMRFCPLLRLELKLRRRILPFFYGSNSIITGDVALVSQLTLDRLHRLEEIAAHWEGPMSLTVYITDREAAILAEYLESSPVLASRNNICIHLVFQEGVSGELEFYYDKNFVLKDEAAYLDDIVEVRRMDYELEGRIECLRQHFIDYGFHLRQERSNYYPINALRNVAIRYSETKHIFVIDFDFIPKPGLYANFLNLLSTTIENTTKVAYIVPAFETFNSQLDFPSTKEELLQQVASEVVKPFRIDVWQTGHLATNYSHWYSTDVAYGVTWDTDFEPYVLINREFGQFDENFVGFGWNKVSFFMLLDALDFKFIVIPDVFIIHFPHAPSVESNRFRHSVALRLFFFLIFRHCLEELKVRYIKDLASRYGVKSLKYLRFRHRTQKL